jgi:hypothetical protein
MKTKKKKKTKGGLPSDSETDGDPVHWNNKERNLSKRRTCRGEGRRRRKRRKRRAEDYRRIRKQMEILFIEIIKRGTWVKEEPGEARTRKTTRRKKKTTRGRVFGELSPARYVRFLFRFFVHLSSLLHYTYHHTKK